MKKGKVRRPEQSARQFINPDVAAAEMKVHGLTPLVPYPGTGTPWLCIHDECGREVSPSRSNVLSGQGACRMCADEKNGKRRRLPWMQVQKVFTDAGFTLLATENEYKTAMKPMSCLCGECDREVNISYNDMSRGHGCRYCHNKQFIMKPTHVYLMKHSGLGALKVGITLQNPAKMKGKRKHPRFREHQLSGFRVVRTWDFTTGEQAFNVEQEVLRHWREDLDAPACVTPEQMCHHGSTCCAGYTETANTRKVGLKRTIDYIDQLTTV